MDMYAVLVTVQLNRALSDEEAAEYLQTNVLPRARQQPGVVSGYWLAPEGGQGLSIRLFENEAAAQAAAADLRNAPSPDFLTLASVEVRKVIAQL